MDRVRGRAVDGLHGTSPGRERASPEDGTVRSRLAFTRCAALPACPSLPGADMLWTRRGRDGAPCEPRMTIHAPQPAAPQPGAPMIAAPATRASNADGEPSAVTSARVAPVGAARPQPPHRSTAHRRVTLPAAIAPAPASSRGSELAVDPCAGAHALGFAFSRGELPPSVGAALAAHAARCGRCRARLATDRQLLAALGRLRGRDQALPAPARLRARVATLVTAVAERRAAALQTADVASERAARSDSRASRAVEA